MQVDFMTNPCVVLAIDKSQDPEKKSEFWNFADQLGPQHMNVYTEAFLGGILWWHSQFRILINQHIAAVVQGAPVYSGLPQGMKETTRKMQKGIPMVYSCC